MPDSDQELSPQGRSRRNFLRIAPLAGAGLALGVYSLKDLLNDRAAELDTTGAGKGPAEPTNPVLTREQEEAYASLKSSIDRQQAPQLAQALETDWIQDSAKASPVIAKSLAYTLSTNLPQKEELLQTVLKKVPYARTIRFNVSDEKQGGDSAVALPELARKGYMGVPVNGEAFDIKPDFELAIRLEEYIRKLPHSSQKSFGGR